MNRRPAPGAPPVPSAGKLAAGGVDPSWSRFVDVPSPTGPHRWHLLDRPGTDPAAPVVVCVHGNPTWSVLWGPVIAAIDPRHRVVAPDQLDMGCSARTPARRFVDRVRDLDDLLGALAVTGPVVLVGHDWGGAVAMGWAVDHPDRVRTLVLANTGIAVPAGRRAPTLIRLAATRGLLAPVTRWTSTFVRGTSRLPGSDLAPAVRTLLAAPYRRREHRHGVEAFVADVPFDDTHPSAGPIARVAERLSGLDVPALIVSGSRDPVFDDDFAEDLHARFPDSEVHRVPGASHLSVLHPGVPTAIARWIGERVADVAPAEREAAVTVDEGDAPPAAHRALWAGLAERSGDTSVGFVDGTSGREVTFAEMARTTAATAGRLRGLGVAPGDRIGVLVPPSVELVSLVYACWRVGAVPVIADRGLGLRALGTALTGARPDHLVGPPPAIAAARVFGWARRARRLRLADVVPDDARDDATLGVDDATDGLGPAPSSGDPAAVLFTSGATGPAKGVRYTHGQLAAQRDALTALFDIGPEDAFVAAFAPFALYGPALGIASAVPDVDVTTPGDLTAAALEDACARIGASMVFASPAALANVVATADGVATPALATVRTVMSAGAPVPAATLRAMARLTPAATLHTPYGMTESLPVADVDLRELEEVGPGRGVCVGAPMSGVSVRIVPLGFDPTAAVGEVGVGVTGEVLVRSAWTSAGYDRRWAVEREARPVDVVGRVWHRSGDVGHLDDRGRLWIEGRSVHVIESADGPVTPVPVEVAVEQLPEVRRAAAVGVGPPGTAVVAVVVETGDPTRRRGPRRRDAVPALAPAELTDAVRAAVAPLRVAAVCTIDRLPVDIRHEAKIDRSALSDRVSRLLAGGVR